MIRPPQPDMETGPRDAQSAQALAPKRRDWLDEIGFERRKSVFPRRRPYSFVLN